MFTSLNICIDNDLFNDLYIVLFQFKLTKISLEYFDSLVKNCDIFMGNVLEIPL